MNEQPIQNENNQVSTPIAPKEIPSNMKLLFEAFEKYKTSIDLLLKMSLIPAAMSLIFALLSDDKKFIGFGFFPESTNAILGLILMLLLVIAQFWGQLSFLYAAKENNPHLLWSDAYKNTKHLVLAYWWVLFLLGFIITGGIIFLLFPAFLFAIWFSFAPYVLIDENLRGMNALLKSKEYVRGSFGRVLNGIFFGLMVSLVPAIFANILDSIFHKKIFSMVINWVLIMPVSTLFFYSLYRNIKAKRGEFVFNPTFGAKLGYVIIGVLGVAAILVPIYILTTFAPDFIAPPIE